MKRYEIIIKFKISPDERQWTGEDIAKENDCACYMFEENEIEEQVAKAKSVVLPSDSFAEIIVKAEGEE